MSNKEIKAECEFQYAAIKEAEEHLTILRAECKHEHTYKGLYSYRVGAINNALICSYCGSCLKVIK